MLWLFKMEQNAFHASGRVPPKWWCRQLESITQWPFQWVESNGEETDDLALVSKKEITSGGIEGESDKNAAVFVTTISYTVSAKPYLQCKHDKSLAGLFQV